MLVENIDITSYLKAFRKFEQFRKHRNTETEKAALIQSFEWSFELSWKTMKRILEHRGRKANSPREIIRLAASDNLINDPEQWFIFIDKRNMTSHTYDEAESEQVISICDSFSNSVKSFLKNIGVPDDQY